MFSLRSFVVVATLLAFFHSGDNGLVAAKPISHLQKRQCTATLTIADVRDFISICLYHKAHAVDEISKRPLHCSHIGTIPLQGNITKASSGLMQCVAFKLVRPTFLTGSFFIVKNTLEVIDLSAT